MKVGTDGVLLGAWANFNQPSSLLDIGSGSGLISLMMAQRFPDAQITGIEIESNAYAESIINIENSSFKDKIQIVHTAIQTFSPTGIFDAIVCNPPFFVDSLKTPHNQRNLARHTDSLSLNDLFSCAVKMLHKVGSLAMVFPFEQSGDLSETAKEFGLYPSRICAVKGRQDLQPKRILIQFVLEELPTETSELIIEKERHQYTDEYIDLVKHFYLKM